MDHRTKGIPETWMRECDKEKARYGGKVGQKREKGRVNLGALGGWGIGSNEGGEARGEKDTWVA